MYILVVLLIVIFKVELMMQSIACHNNENFSDNTKVTTNSTYIGKLVVYYTFQLKTAIHKLIYNTPVIDIRLVGMSLYSIIR